MVSRTSTGRPVRAVRVAAALVLGQVLALSGLAFAAAPSVVASGAGVEHAPFSFD